MRKEDVTALFEKQAASYDQHWGSRLSPINATLHLLTSAALSGLPAHANVLCVGAGTGAEILGLAAAFPGWRFTAVEPAKAMLEVLRQKAEAAGIASHCHFHAGYLDSLPHVEPFDAATAFLVSQFITDRNARSQFFRGIADRLGPHGIVVSSDLAGDLATVEGRDLLGVWFQVMSGSGALPTEESIQRMREAYSRDVAVLPPNEVRDIVMQGGFATPVQFFQAGLIHAWYAKKAV